MFDLGKTMSDSRFAMQGQSKFLSHWPKAGCSVTNSWSELLFLVFIECLWLKVQCTCSPEIRRTKTWYLHWMSTPGIYVDRSLLVRSDPKGGNECSLIGSA